MYIKTVAFNKVYIIFRWHYSKFLFIYFIGKKITGYFFRQKQESREHKKESKNFAVAAPESIRLLTCVFSTSQKWQRGSRSTLEIRLINQLRLNPDWHVRTLDAPVGFDLGFHFARKSCLGVCSHQGSSQEGFAIIII
jgi:hypothetical protein